MIKLTQEQYELISGKQYDGEQYFNPIQDVNGDWFISKQEQAMCGDEFAWLKELKPSEFQSVKEQ